MQHQEQSEGRWYTLTLAEQMANIGSEVGRAARAEGKNQERFDGAVRRASELFDLTISDARHRGRVRELARAREIFSDAILGGKEYGSRLSDLERYFLPFAIVVRSRVV